MDESLAWQLLQALAADPGAIPQEGCIGFDERGVLRALPRERSLLALAPEHAHGFLALTPLQPSAQALLELYLPLCTGARAPNLLLAHLGQSLDGRVATVTGASRYVTGPEDLRHTHRLRALFDVVLIGAETAHADDPQLTTRLVPGRQPVRVVLDPRGRLDPGLRLLRDGSAPTLVISAPNGKSARAGHGAHVEQVTIACDDAGCLELEALLAALRTRGLRRIFIEGGGITVSRFLEAGLLDRLQLAVAPKIIGSGTPVLSLSPIACMSQAIEARCRRVMLGNDVLFDCDLRAEPA